jgi:hypothetical protein
MSRFSLPALACACVMALVVSPPAPADQAKTVPASSDRTAEILNTLDREVQWKDGINLSDIPLLELLQLLSKQHDVPFLINEESFKAIGIPDLREAKPDLAATSLRGLRLHQLLRVVLEPLHATFLIKNNAIQIVSVEYAAEVTGSSLAHPNGEGAYPRLRAPLVSMNIKALPLKDAVGEIAERYDLTVAVSPQAGEARKEPVSARLLNAPADKALELLALQADLRVVRRGTSFLITSKEHAGEIFDEEQNKERQKIELKRLREEKPVSARP